MALRNFWPGARSAGRAIRDRLAPDALNAVSAAEREAARLGFHYVGPEHLLLGLLTVNDPAVRGLLLGVGIRVVDLRAHVETRLGANAATSAGPPARPLPHTSRAVKAQQFAVVEAERRGARKAVTLHLLLGLLAEPTARIGQLLRGAGASPERLQAVLLGHEPGFRPAGLDLRIDETSNKLSYEQIVDQVREAVATGALSAGERLPSIRQLADQLGLAPGTVARAYSELEVAGAVVTDGARGTFVAVSARRSSAHDGRGTAVRDLLRSAVVAAFHLGTTAQDLRASLEDAMKDIYVPRDERGRRS